MLHFKFQISIVMLQIAIYKHYISLIIYTDHIYFKSLSVLKYKIFSDYYMNIVIHDVSNTSITSKN